MAKGESNNSYFNVYRSETTRELMRDKNAFMLLVLIACRAKRTNDLSVHDLQPGQALIGDFKSAGLTERSYRTAKQHLEKYGLATFNATNKGTIATLTDTRVFGVNIELNDEQNASQATDRRRTNDDYQEYKNDKNIRVRRDHSHQKPFQRPEPAEVSEYARSIGFHLDGQYFCDSYETKGWLINNNSPMKDWKAAVRTWKAKQGQFIIASRKKAPAMTTADVREMIAAGNNGGAK